MKTATPSKIRMTREKYLQVLRKVVERILYTEVLCERHDAKREGRSPKLRELMQELWTLRHIDPANPQAESQMLAMVADHYNREYIQGAEAYLSGLTDGFTLGLSLFVEFSDATTHE